MASTSNGDSTAATTTKAPAKTTAKKATAKKTTAKKTAAKRAASRRPPAARGKVAVVMLAATHDAKAGDRVEVAGDVAEQLVERGHARKAGA